MEFILVGQPNSGKSTIFNNVVGYKSIASNFPGVTVNYTSGDIYFENEKIKVIDIPGTYSLQTTDEAELAAVEYLFEKDKDTVIINTVDASVLSRSLELTLQIMELQRPMVIALNMMDEANRKGIKINTRKLTEITGVPVVETIGRKGKGIFALFKAAYKAGKNKTLPNSIDGPTHVEKYIKTITEYLKEKKIQEKWNHRFVAIKCLEHDPLIRKYLISQLKKSEWNPIQESINKLEKKLEKNSEFIISSVRHNLAFKIFEDTAVVGLPQKKDIRNKIDSVLMHPFWGYIFMITFLYLTFLLVFSIGDAIEPLFRNNLDKLTGFLTGKLNEDTFIFSVLSGVLNGFGGGLAIVIPYLLPFFIALSFLEDTGYLARIAYLIDNVMHRIGLHGMSIVPMILGYGCTVPGIMATRILKCPRDKFITATLTSMVPCSARMIIIIGVAGSISMKAAIMVYVLNIITLGITGKVMSKLMPEVSPGLILEIPKYHLPGIKALANKTWYRMKEFILIAWPLLIIGSIVLELINHFQLANPINIFLQPFTTDILGLPAVVGIILLLGILRKELALILLISAFGTKDLLVVMTPTQIYTFTIFATFYIPCLATFAVLGKELRWRNAVLIALLTFTIAVILSVLVRLIFPLFF